MRRQPRFRGTQTGVALITAVLIVTLAAIVAGNLFWSNFLSMRRTETTLYTDQAYLYALGAEAWAADILKTDAQDSNHDHLGEEWAVSLPPLPIDGGLLEGLVEDMQGRFNINNLVAGNGAVDEDVLVDAANVGPSPARLE